MQTRKDIEVDKAEYYFNAICDKFHYALFTLNLDDHNSPDVYDMFNKQWIKVANLYNRKSKRVKVDPEAFFNYAINKDI